jgi:hypothetical protein
MAVLKGLSSGAFNNAQVVWIINIWKERSGPYLQALQFCISIGSFITPLMNKPFLIDCSIDSYFGSDNNGSIFGELIQNSTQFHFNVTMGFNYSGK